MVLDHELNVLVKPLSTLSVVFNEDVSTVSKKDVVRNIHISKTLVEIGNILQSNGSLRTKLFETKLSAV